MKSSWRKFFCRHGDLVKAHEVSLSRMVSNFLTVMEWQVNKTYVCETWMPQVATKSSTAGQMIWSLDGLPDLSGRGITRAPRGTDRSPEYNEHFCYKLDSRVKKFDYRMEPKTTTLHNTCFKITAMNSVCCCSLQVWRRSFLKKGNPPPMT